MGIVDRRILARALAALAAALGVVATQTFVLYNQAFDYTTFLVGVAAPLALGVAAFAVVKDRVLLLAYLGLFWSFVEDAPVYLDSLHTWPEVTRFNPYLPHLALEILFHAATLGFLLLAAREALGRPRPASPTTLVVYVLTLAAFVLAYAQNLPVEGVQAYVESSWYTLDVAEHLASAGVLGLALVLASRTGKGGRAYPPSDPERRGLAWRPRCAEE